jgi:hypothetical protein
MPSVRRASKSIPSIGSRTATYEINDYSKGYNSYISNDKFPINNDAPNMWRLAQDARIPALGEYETRKGFDFHSVAVGETKDDNQESTTGAADKSFNTVTRYAQKFTTTSSGKLPRIDVRLKNDAAATGTILLELWSNISGAPGVLIARSSLASSDLTSAYVYKEVRFAEAPTLANTTDYWIVGYVQETSSGSYKWSSTTSGTDALVSTNSGTTWATTSYALNFKQYYATTGAVKGFHRAYKSDGTKVTLFAHGTVLYSVNNVTGALTSVKTGLSASATKYRFKTVNDIVYYVNGFDGYRKLTGGSFGTDAQVNSTNYTDIIVHKGIVFLVQKDDPTRIDYSNFGDYETFTSTDFIHVPAPKTGDPITSLNSLNGYLLIRTQNKAHILSGDDNATFSLSDAPDQKGTYSAETSVSDKSYNYFLSDDGVYKSNGTQPVLISENIYQEVISMTNKDDACMAISRGRLYLWYTSAGASANDSCFVWNLNYSGGADTVESHDTNAFVSFAVSGFQDDDELLVASSRLGQIFWQEKESNDYTNLGGDINYLLATHYLTFASPAVLKEIRFWEPRFGAQDGMYAISCEYAYDQRDNWQTYSNEQVQGAGSLWGSAVWGAFTWGSTAEVQAPLYVPGEYRRIALRYKHYATRQPQKFLGHTLVVQTRRIR